MNKINIRITERDRQAADHFSSNRSCLIATALRRRGYKDPYVGTISATINGNEFEMDRAYDGWRLHSRAASEPPFYDRDVVGTKITFTPKEA